MDELADPIKQKARLAVESFSPLSEIDFGLNEESVEWVEGYVERMRKRADFNDGSWNGLIDTIGAFLGECILARTGGAWEMSDDRRCCIRFPTGECAFPMTKVAKQFADGLVGGKSISNIYNVCVEFAANGGLTRSAPQTSE